MSHIQQLIRTGQLPEALDYLAATNAGAILLKAQYNNGRKKFKLGLIDLSEWNRIHDRVKIAALQMAESIPTPPADFDIAAWIHRIISGPTGLETYEEREFVIWHIPPYEVAATWVIRCLANPDCEGSQQVLDSILARRARVSAQKNNTPTDNTSNS